MVKKLRNVKKKVKKFSDKELFKEYQTLLNLTNEELLKKFNFIG